MAGAAGAERPAPLLVRIRERIARAGPLSLDRFMEIALQDPEHGYYRCGTPIGRAGDFITAPEISQIFGELAGLWLAERWLAMGRPEPVRLVELGPGRGTLMADIWRACRVVPGFHDAATIHLVESNARLAGEQKRRLPRAHVHVDIAELPEGPMLLVANEFFDALPIRQFLRTRRGWRERAVGFDDRTGRLMWTDIPVAEADLRAFVSARLAAEAREGAVIEVSPAARALAAALARRLAAAGGAALIIDYGYMGPAVGDTLQAVYRHRPADPLARPGEQDLTAHVDFAPLAAAAREAGLAVFGPVAQGRFLMELGLAVRLERLCRGKPPAVAAQLRSGAHRLVAPEEMGVLFQVMAWTSIAAPPPGFGSASAE